MTRRPPTHPTSLSGLKDLVAHQDYLVHQRPRVDDSDQVRRRYNAAISFVEHRAMRAFLDTAGGWLEAHQGRPPAKWLGVQGPFHSGKSEMAAMLTMKVCREVWDTTGYEVEDDEGLHVVYPAAYVVVGPNDSERGLCEQLMFALDMPEPPRRDTATTSRLLALIAAQMRRSRTELVCWDDTHQLPAGRGRTATKFFKQMFSTLPTSLLFVADRLDDTWLLKPSNSDSESQKAAEQLAERKIIATNVPVPMNAAGQAEWVELVQLCLDALVLRKQHTLTGADYAWLFEVAQGHRAKLLQVIITAGRLAVGHTERVDRPGLDTAVRMLGDDS